MTNELSILPDDQAQEWAEEHYIDGFPDFSRFDDTVKDDQGKTARDRARDLYYDHLERSA